MKRKVREDFDPTKEYSVDVEDCTVKEKKEVQQAYFDAGILWQCYGARYQYIGAKQYSNKHAIGGVAEHLLYWGTAEGCNMSAKEFLDLVYEPKQQGYVHAKLMLQFAEDAQTHTEPWELWQFKVKGDVWCDCPRNPHWRVTTEYRRKPKTHTIHGVEVPDLRVKGFNKATLVSYCVDPLDAKLHAEHYLAVPVTTNKFLELGLLYEYTEEGKQAAILHSKAMLGIA